MWVCAGSQRYKNIKKYIEASTNKERNKIVNRLKLHKILKNRKYTQTY